MIYMRGETKVDDSIFQVLPGGAADNGVIRGCRVTEYKKNNVMVHVSEGTVWVDGRLVQLSSEYVYIPVNHQHQERFDWVVVDAWGNLLATPNPDKRWLKLARVWVSPNPGLVQGVEDKRVFVTD